MNSSARTAFAAARSVAILGLDFMDERREFIETRRLARRRHGLIENYAERQPCLRSDLPRRSSRSDCELRIVEICA